MMLVRLQNKPEKVYIKIFLSVASFELKITDKCRRKRVLRKYNGPKIA